MKKIKNKKAYHDYEILEEYEAGLVLKGAEVKPITNGHISLNESFVSILNGEVFLKNAQITLDSNILYDRPDPKRDRKLLLNKKEIAKLSAAVKTKGYTIVPLEIYKSKTNKFKIKIGLAKGLKNYDKRAKLKEKDQKRDMSRAMKREF